MVDIVQAVVRKVEDGYLAACAYPELQCKDDTIDGAITALEGAIRSDRDEDGERFYLVVSLYFGPLSMS